MTFALRAARLAGVTLLLTASRTAGKGRRGTHDLDEAVHLADRIVVLAAHSGRIAEIVEVPVPRPRVRAQMPSGPFLATKRRLEELIYGGDPRGDAQTS